MAVGSQVGVARHRTNYSDPAPLTLHLKWIPRIYNTGSVQHIVKDLHLTYFPVTLRAAVASCPVRGSRVWIYSLTSNPKRFSNPVRSRTRACVHDRRARQGARTNYSSPIKITKTSTDLWSPPPFAENETFAQGDKKRLFVASIIKAHLTPTQPHYIGDATKRVHVRLGEESNSNAMAAGPSGSSDAMNIRDGALREIVIDNHVDTLKRDRKGGRRVLLHV